MTRNLLARHIAVSAGLFSTILIAGCAPHTWVAGPNVSAADFTATQARCSMMARHGGQSVSAYGPTGFVVAAQIGNAIGNAFQAHADFDDCMQASGFLIADDLSPGAGAAAPSAFTPQAESHSARILTPENAMSVETSALASPVLPKPALSDALDTPVGTNPLLIPPSTPTGEVTYRWINTSMK